MFLYDLDGKSRKLIANVPYWITDFQVESGTLLALGKKRSGLWHLSSTLLAWSGHAPAFENWAVLEIDLKSGTVQTFPVVEDLRNGYAYFPHKWDMQDH